MNKKMNIKALALILLTSALLITTIGTASVNAQTQPSVYVYNSQGGNINGNGTKLTPSTVYNYTNGDVISYTATPGTGFSFLCWDWIAGSTPITSTNSTLTETFSGSTACAIQALFVPASNATQTTTGSGAATVVTLLSADGTTSPASGSSTSATSSYTNYTIGTASAFQATASSGFKFLYWLVVSTQGRTDYTSSTLNLTIPASEVAIQAFFVPTSSTVTVPTIPEYSSVAVVILAAVLAISALGTFVYAKRRK
ncbi:MAG: hypothetical protein ABSB71_01800 [Candidatus Bathyarchaeia archaeon]